MASSTESGHSVVSASCTSSDAMKALMPAANVASGAPASSSEASAARITGRRSVATKGVRVQGRAASQHDPLDRSASELAETAIISRCFGEGRQRRDMLA